ncbi:MAG TPA: aldehyde dehydrogenase family protein [Polyangiaceae bacterium]
MVFAFARVTLGSPCSSYSLAGGAGAVAALGVAEGKGYFVTPTLLLAAGAKPGDAAHTHEVFGPVATVIPDDRDFARAPVEAIAGNSG